MPKLKRVRIIDSCNGPIVFAAKEGEVDDYAAHVLCFRRGLGSEEMEVDTLNWGVKISHSWAAAIFPDMDAKLTWRP